MCKVGYLTKKHVKGKIYIYVRQSYRESNSVKHRYLFSFGVMPEALNKMYRILEQEEPFPETLSESHFTLEDVYDWILTIETGVTSKGRSFLM